MTSTLDQFSRRQRAGKLRRSTLALALHTCIISILDSFYIFQDGIVIHSSFLYHNKIGGFHGVLLFYYLR